MDDVKAKMEQAVASIAQFQKEKDDAEADWKHHEALAKDAIARYQNAKTELGTWRTLLSSYGVVQRVQSAEEAVAAAKASAETHEQKAAGHAADLEKMKAEVAAELAKLRAANAAAEKPTEPPK